MTIREELVKTLPTLGPLERHRLEQRTNYDLEMIEQLGYCKGIENYSRHFDGRTSGEPPFCLLDFFKHSPFSKDFLLVIDESHATVPQVGGMFAGDRSRKKISSTTVSGCRPRTTIGRFGGMSLNSIWDTRFFVSATPAEYERSTSGQVVELVVRPTGLVDPEITVKPIAGCIADLMTEIIVTREQEAASS